MTPATGRGAIGVVQLRAADDDAMDGLLGRAKLRAVIGRPVLSDLLGVDRGLVVRWDGLTVDLFAHGGPALMRGLVRALEGLGVACAGCGAAYPEAADELEARMLGALARAASPLAVDLLLDQPRRWGTVLRARRGDVADGPILRRLIEPPLVVAIGPANVGKSTLLNRLAGRSVSIVADEPGTTRDHVGASLVLDGLAVRYLDTPGLLDGARGVDREAIELASGLAASADLVLACGDPGHAPPAVDRASGPGSGRVSGRGVLRVCLRRDLGAPSWGADTEVCARGGVGLDGLARAVRARLVPDAVLGDPRPWRFWDV